MKKVFGVLSVFCLSLVSIGQVSTTKSLNVHLEGLVVGAYNSTIVLINQNVKKGQVPVATFKTDEKGGFLTDFTIPFSDYYYFRIENGQGVNLILNGNDSIKIYADAKDLLFNCNIIGSDESDRMKEFYQQYVPFKQFEDSLRNVLKFNQGLQAQVNAAFKPKAEAFYGYRNSFIKQQTNSPALFAVLPSVNQETEFALYKQVSERLSTIFPTSPTVNAVSSQVTALQAKKEAQKRIAPGKIAPEIIIPGVDGEPIKLSDLRGKVVLIDFWASWCGPCRRENPNVVEAYNKYNKDGFEVFSISFDKKGNKERWLAAIKQDGLVWENHGSELNYFTSQAGRDYSVGSIPFTCLIDKDGKIIATNLRGPALEAQLKLIFGY